MLHACLSNATVAFRKSASLAELRSLAQKYQLNPRLRPMERRQLLELPPELVNCVCLAIASDGVKGVEALLRLASTCKVIHVHKYRLISMVPAAFCHTMLHLYSYCTDAANNDTLVQFEPNHYCR